MEYLPGSYESKLNTLFKQSPKTSRNTTLFSPKFPILIPSPSIDQNRLETPPPSPGHHPFGPFYENLFTTSTTTSTTTSMPIPEKVVTFTRTTEFPIIDTFLDLDLDGNISDDGNFVPSSSPDFEKLLNKTLWNVSTIVNEFLGNHTTLPSSTTPIAETNAADLATTMFPLFGQNSTDDSDTDMSMSPDNSTNTSTTTRPPIFRDISPIASTELLVTYGFFVIFLAIVGIISNSATIHVLFKESINLHIKKHYTNMTILSLAMVNLLASIFVGFGGGLNVIVIGFGSISGNRIQISDRPATILNSTLTPTPLTPTPFHISNYDNANSSVIATLISAYANVTFADLSKLNESMNANANATGSESGMNVSQIFPTIHRRKISPHQNNQSNHQNGGGFCRLQCFFNNLGNFVTIWTLAVISADRFLAHTWPLKYNELVTRQKFAILMAYIWLQGIFFSSLSIEFWTRDDLLDSGVASGFCHCSINWLYIPRNAPMGVTFFKLFAFMWMSLFPYTVILALSTILVVHLLTKTETVVTTMSGEELTRSPFDSGVNNPVNRFFQSNPQQDQMIWRVMPPPLSPNSPNQDSTPVQYGNPPLKELFSSTFAGTQMRRSRLWELKQGGVAGVGKAPQQSQREATTESVLTCYLAVIFAYAWLQTTPGCLSFLLFVLDGGQGSFLIAEMMSFLFKLIGFSVNAGIYFWLRKDFHDAFSGLFRQLCACDGNGRARTGPGTTQGAGGGVIPGVVVGEEW